MDLTIRFAGYGGYGTVTASRILGQLFAQQGFHVLQTESHGAAARGGACTADLTISSEPIYELAFEKPNILVVLSIPAFRKCCAITPDLSSNLLLIETELLGESSVQTGLSPLFNQNKTQIYQIELRRIAEYLGHVRYIGIASLGALATLDSRIDIASLERTIRLDEKLHRFKKENIYALKAGAKAITRYGSR